MADRVLITHEPLGGVLGDTLNRSTGALVANPATAPVTVYDDPVTPGLGGVCIIKSGTGLFADESQNPEEIEQYELLLPWNAAVPAPGDVGHVTLAQRDSSLMGKLLYITAVDRGTFLIARKLHALEYEAAKLRLTGGGGAGGG
jgi:hypothetical protein